MQVRRTRIGPRRTHRTLWAISAEGGRKEAGTDTPKDRSEYKSPEEEPEEPIQLERTSAARLGLSSQLSFCFGIPCVSSGVLHPVPAALAARTTSKSKEWEGWAGLAQDQVWTSEEDLRTDPT